MKNLYIYLCLFFLTLSAWGQKGDFDVKVSLYQYKTTVGHLKVVNSEGIGIEDFSGKYHIFKPTDIKNITVRKRRLSFRKIVGIGTLTGLGAAAVLATASEKVGISEGLLEATVVLTGAGASAGLITATISEITKRKLRLKINGDANYFKKNYGVLLEYINTTPLTEHFTN